MAKSANITCDMRTLRDAGRINNPRTIRDLRFRDVFVTHSKSTR